MAKSNEKPIGYTQILCSQADIDKAEKIVIASKIPTTRQKVLQMAVTLGLEMVENTCL